MIPTNVLSVLRCAFLGAAILLSTTLRGATAETEGFFEDSSPVDPTPSPTQVATPLPRPAALPC